MATWHVRRISTGGWQVLTPAYTQACAICADEENAVAAAYARVADEGGGFVAVHSWDGEVSRTVSVAPSLSPYLSAPIVAGSRQPDEASTLAG